MTTTKTITAAPTGEQRQGNNTRDDSTRDGNTRDDNPGGDGNARGNGASNNMRGTRQRDRVSELGKQQGGQKQQRVTETAQETTAQGVSIAQETTLGRQKQKRQPGVT